MIESCISVSHYYICVYKVGFPCNANGKESSASAGDARDLGSIPGLGRSPGGGNGNALQYYLENPMDKGAWQATVDGVTKNDTTERARVHTHTHTHTHTHKTMYIKTSYMFFILEGDHTGLSLFLPCYCRLRIGVQKPREDFLIGFIGALIWEQSSRWGALPTSSRT